MEEKYLVPENPQYSADIRKLQDSDPASASAVFNPLFQKLIENIHYLYQGQRAERRHVLAVRERDPSKPDYGLDSGLSPEGGAVLSAGPYTGTAEVSVLVSGVEYDAENMYTAREGLPDGALIIRPEEA